MRIEIDTAGIPLRPQKVADTYTNCRRGLRLCGFELLISTLQVIEMKILQMRLGLLQQF